MLIETITFEIRDFNTNQAVDYMIENTIENQEKVFAHRFTRAIKFAKVFSFQFEKEMNMPIEFVDMETWMRMLDVNPELAAVAELESV